MKILFITFLTFLINPLNILCKPSADPRCPDGQAPLADYFCGRGLEHQDCPTNSTCVIASDDTYAVCCPDAKIATTTTKSFEKPGSCPEVFGRVGSCTAFCTFDSDCHGHLKCCGADIRRCVTPDF